MSPPLLPPTTKYFLDYLFLSFYCTIILPPRHPVTISLLTALIATNQSFVNVSYLLISCLRPLPVVCIKPAIVHDLPFPLHQQHLLWQSPLVSSIYEYYLTKKEVQEQCNACRPHHESLKLKEKPSWCVWGDLVGLVDWIS